MDLIEKVAKNLCIDFGYSPNAVDRDRKGAVLNSDRKAWMIFRKQAQAAIAAMPSIKWQKIETLSNYDEVKRLLIWCSTPTIVMYHGYRDKYYKYVDKYGNCIDYSLVTHWAEINAPEDE